MAGLRDTNLSPVLPPGTRAVALVDVRGNDGQVACPKGAMVVIVASPDDPHQPYRVRFNQTEASLRREELTVLTHYQRPAANDGGDTLAGQRLYDHVILRVVIGSQAYGLATEASDIDRRGIYLPPADMHWSLRGVPEQIENDATQEVYWELRKFLLMALKANPNVLEVLYSSVIEDATPLANELLSMRQSFLSKLVYQTYSGYVMSQFRKLQADLRTTGQPKWKHAMHLIRLLMAGVTVLREGRVPVHVGEHRDRLLAVRRGEVAWEELDAWRLALQQDLADAFERSPLPERPNYEAADAFLLKARRAAL